MDLVPWGSFGEMKPWRGFRQEMEDFWNRFARTPLFLEASEQEWMPSANITETERQFTVTAELPGLDKEDIKLSIQGDLLTIEGEKKQEKEEKADTHHSVERYFGTFKRSFRLPAEVQNDKIEADFDKGVLKITLPKTEEAKKKALKIKIK